MKSSIFFALALLLFGHGIMAQSIARMPYTLTVDISRMKPKPGKLIISYYDYETEKRMTDTASAASNKVIFKGTLAEPVLVLLNQYPPVEEKNADGGFLLSGKSGSRAAYYAGTGFFLEPGKIQLLVKDSIKSIKVTGSKTQNDYEQLQAKKKPYLQKQKELQAKMAGYLAAGDSANLAIAVTGSRLISSELKEKVYKPYIIEHAHSSPVVLKALQEFGDYGRADYHEFEALFNSISVQFQSLPSAVALKQRIYANAFTAVGAIAPDFTQNDTLDRPVSLSSFRGKYVLVDFWASWCGPCRKENRNLVQSYNRFKDKGFTVLGVSLDQPGKKEAWLKAIHDDQLTWTQVSDLAFWKNAAAKMYGVTGVPANFLIDPQGKIVAKYLRGADLDKKLGEILGD